MELRLASLEGAYQQVADRLNGMDTRLNGIENRIEALDRKIDMRIEGVYREIGAFRESVASEFRDLRRDTNQRFTWVMGMIMGAWLTTILTVLFHHS